MAAFLEWTDCTARYPELDKLSTTPSNQATLIAQAEAYLHGQLAGTFTTPFSSNNMTARELAVDVLFWQTHKARIPDRAAAVYETLKDSIEALKSGASSMVTTSGSFLSAPTEALWSSTQGYNPTFTTDNETRWAVDSNQIDDTRTARGEYT